MAKSPDAISVNPPELSEFGRVTFVAAVYCASIVNIIDRDDHSPDDLDMIRNLAYEAFQNINQSRATLSYGKIPDRSLMDIPGKAGLG